MEQLIAHLWGDYILQSDWKANSKVNQSFACLCHVLLYGLPFFIIGASWTALLVIVATHFFIDRFRLAKYVVFAKQFLCPPNQWFCKWTKTENEWEFVVSKYSWENCKATGYPSETPPFLSVWLLIIADNTLHLTINFLALKYL